MIRVNHRDELSKRIKHNHLVANCVIFHNVTEFNTTQDPQ
ncbi:Tn3 family transposase (plasmid) [Acaryochloris sp. 'Moss Beach']|nr:Tn3 family transposase [Acaryochloris sp. 'Moss Beach']